MIVIVIVIVLGRNGSRKVVHRKCVFGNSFRCRKLNIRTAYIQKAEYSEMERTYKVLLAVGTTFIRKVFLNS